MYNKCTPPRVKCGPLAHKRARNACSFKVAKPQYSASDVVLQRSKYTGTCSIQSFETLYVHIYCETHAGTVVLLAKST